MRSFRSVVEQMRGLVRDSIKAIEDVLVSVLPGAATLLTGAISAALVARGLGPSGMGQYALVISISTFTVALSDLGIGKTAIRYAARAASLGDVDGQFSVLRWAFRLRMIFILSISLLVFILAPTLASVVWHDSTLTFLLRLALLIGIFTTLAHVPIIYLQSIRRFRMNSAIQIAQALISFAGILLIASLALWYLQFVIAISVITAAIGAVAFITVTPRAAFFKRERSSGVKHFRLKGTLTAPAIKSDNTSLPDSSNMASYARFNFLDSVVSTVGTYASIWLIGIFLVKSQVGIYAAATYVALPITVLQTGVSVTLWPRIAASVTLERTKDLLRRALTLTLVVVVAALIYAVLAPLLMPLVFGATYASGIPVAQLLCLGWCISTLALPIGLVGYNFGVVRISWLINLGVLIILTVVNVFLLPVMGSIAAALAFVFAQIFGGACNAIFLWNKMR